MEAGIPASTFPMDKQLEAVVYITRKLHWSRKEIGQLTPKQFGALLNELAYQEAIERYERLQMFASLLSIIHNAPISKPKIMRADDFIKLEYPTRWGETKPSIRGKSQTGKEMLAAVQLLNAAYGGAVIEKE